MRQGYYWTHVGKLLVRLINKLLMQENYLKFLRKVYRKIQSRNPPQKNVVTNLLRGQSAGDKIREVLESPYPAMICRFGSVELDCLATYLSIKNNKNDFIKYIRGEIAPFWWDRELIYKMSVNAGFFPADVDHLEKFSELMFSEMKLVDILGSWLPLESLFEKELTKCIKVSKGDLLPFHHKEPYSVAFAGKKILVVHPFDESIRKQYAKKELLFSDQRVLPDFDLITLRSVQSIANNQTPFQDWFQALDYMKNQIANIDFDIALIGCGAYGFPLAAHVKRIGKKSLHLGGPTQILFGIMGKRWEEEPGNDYISKNFANKHWSRPLLSEIPQGNDKIENGCYW